MIKRFTLLVLLAAVGTGFAGAQTSGGNTAGNLDFHLGTPVVPGVCTYAKDTAANHTQWSRMTPVDGWTYGVENGDARAAGLFRYGSGAWLGGPKFVVPDSAAEAASGGNALGAVAVWTGTVQYVDSVTLPAAHYRLTIPVYNAGGATRPVKSLIGFIATGGAEYLAAAKVYQSGTWTNETIEFTLDSATTGCFSLGYTAPNLGSDANQHLFFDRVTVDTIPDAVVARAELEAALGKANEQLEDMSNVGPGLFQKSEQAYNAFADAVARAQDVCDNAASTAAELRAAIAALAAATEEYEHAGLNEPQEGTGYTFAQKASGLYLALNPAGTAGSGEVDAVALSATPYVFAFVKADNGWYLADTLAVHESYLGAPGNNKWSMSATADNKVACTFTRLSDGFYTIDMAGYRSVGTDDTAAGAKAWADKYMTRDGYDNNLCQWLIAEYEAPQPDGIREIGRGDVASGAVYSIDGRCVGDKAAFGSLRRGIYIIGGKKIAK